MLIICAHTLLTKACTYTYNQLTHNQPCVCTPTHTLTHAHTFNLCVQLFVGGALVSLDAEKVRNMRPKLRVMLVRFIAKVGVLCVFQQHSF